MDEDSQPAIGGTEVEPVEPTGTLVPVTVETITIGQPPIPVS